MMEKTGIDQEFSEHVQHTLEHASMVKAAMAQLWQDRDGKSPHAVALDLVKKAALEDRTDLSRAYAAEAQVYATLALADSMAKLAEALLP